jgi:hypothetical protein
MYRTKNNRFCLKFFNTQRNFHMSCFIMMR